MKSLAEREAFRAKEREANRLEGERNGTAQVQRSVTSRDSEGKPGEQASQSDSELAAQADEFVAQNVDAIKKSLDDLTDEQLAAVEAAEKRGNARASVFDAVAKSRKARQNAGASWGANK